VGVRALALIAALAGAAAAKPAGVDFVGGTLAAGGAGAPDMAAPSPGIARVAAQRLAEKNARRALLRAALALRAGGKETIAERLGCPGGAAPCKDAAALARLEQGIADEAVEEGIEYFSDGAVRLRARVALEVLRAALDPRDPADVPRVEPDAPTALIVDAAGLGAEPGVTPLVRAGQERWTGPVVYAAGAKDASADQRAGKKKLKLKAKAASGADLTLEDADAATLAAARKSGALIIIVGARK